jgi:hypothetical protein
MGAGVFFGAEGGKDGAAHGRFGCAPVHPDPPLSEALGEKHFDARDSGDASLGGDLQELGLLRAIDQVHDQTAI